MANFATIQPHRRLGLTSDPMVAPIAATSPAVAWRLGAALIYTSGLLVSAAANPTVILGFAADPASTDPTSPTIGAETLVAVGSGTSQAGKRRRFYPAQHGMTFLGSLGTSTVSGGAPGDTALAITDIGTKFGLAPVTSAGVASTTGIWILDRAAGTSNLICKVIALVDPIGAKETDTPVGGINTGQALVEFVVINTACSLYV